MFDRNELIQAITELLEKASFVQLRILYQFAKHLIDP